MSYSMFFVYFFVIMFVFIERKKNSKNQGYAFFLEKSLKSLSVSACKIFCEYFFKKYKY